MFAFVGEIMTWLFWQSIWQVEQLVKKIFVNILPLSLIMEEAIKKFDGVGIKTSFPGDPNIGKYDKKKYHCEIVVHNLEFFRAVAFDDSLSLGETYMVSSLLVCTKSLSDVLHCNKLTKRYRGWFLERLVRLRRCVPVYEWAVKDSSLVASAFGQSRGPRNESADYRSTFSASCGGALQPWK